MAPSRDFNKKKSYVKKQKNTDKYFQGKQGKVDEIKRSLTQRSNLRKGYFKLLEKEGEAVPEKRPRYSREEKSENRYDERGSEGKPEKKRPLSFQERMNIAKERKDRQKKEKMEQTKQKLHELKDKEYKRRERTENIRNAKTRRGQPLMGPRINDLLDRIQKDNT